MSFTAPLPPTRSTGDTPAGGVAADVNTLTTAVRGVRENVVAVVDAGTNLSAARPTGAAAVLWQFSAGVDPGPTGQNIVNGAPGDQWFVADA